MHVRNSMFNAHLSLTINRTTMVVMLGHLQILKSSLQHLEKRWIVIMKTLKVSLTKMMSNMVWKQGFNWGGGASPLAPLPLPIIRILNTCC